MPDLPEAAHLIFGVLAGATSIAIGVIAFFLKRLLAGVDGIYTDLKALTKEFQDSKRDLAVMQAEQARQGSDITALRVHVDQELAAVRARVDQMDRRRGGSR